ncbi:hypothetical protein M409DRAFT_16961 [Zasmidium cellare ATCC 36951]|uniref:PEBP-like protein n=1 Tax=Zasmidium cellare ATCC 36951 TaxID=1080233 RepID=A0A6A6D0X2_ZASCE|nr:uncharacterized protein M409DRAFT_16961 [Zasmidium cellare ATCC 36951]KAF2173011.1 hypothetical protein M409DRAFT_16961 [Zasmidium cellare ATCC 36951]
MKLSAAILSFAWCSAVAVAKPLLDQKPLNVDGRFDLIQQLKKAEIIPTVLDAFHPFLTISISWKKADVDVGNTIKPKKVKNTPDVQLIDDLPELKRTLPQLTLALTDPDAKSRDDPVWSEMCHWIATGIPLTSDGTIDTSQDFKEVVPYKAPAPPKKTGKHRYVFVALTPKNGTHEPLNLTAPADRQHWGYGKERMGVRQWAEDNGLAVIGANFFYAQHKKQ